MDSSKKENIVVDLHLDKYEIRQLVNSLVGNRGECLFYDKSIHCQMYNSNGNPEKEMDIDNININLTYGALPHDTGDKLRGRTFLGTTSKKELNQFDKIIYEYKSKNFKY